MLARDALLAYAHFMCIFALASLLTAELFILRQTLPADLLRRLRLVDRWYGVTAGLVIVSGLLRLNLGLKGADFYVHNPVFWTKMGLFLTVGLISILPTIAYIRWSGRLAADGSIALPGGEYARIRGWCSSRSGSFCSFHSAPSSWRAGFSAQRRARRASTAADNVPTAKTIAANRGTAESPKRSATIPAASGPTNCPVPKTVVTAVNATAAVAASLRMRANALATAGDAARPTPTQIAPAIGAVTPGQVEIQHPSAPVGERQNKAEARSAPGQDGHDR